VKNWERPRKPSDVLSRPDTVWRKWQLDLKAELDKEPDDRTILWLWEPTGNVGKSAFAKHYAIKGNAILALGSAHNVKAAIALWMKNSPEADLKYVFYDIPRSSTDVDYTALEQIKNGCFFSGKYESGSVVFPDVHLVCFSNREPIYDQLSKDRWKVIEI